MQKRGFKISGIVLVIVGIVLIINSFSGITGFAILENVTNSTSSILGIILVVVGILVSKRGRSSVESTIDKS